MKKYQWAYQQGTIFLTTIVCMFIMIIIGGYIFQVTTQDTHLIAEMKKSLQAQQIAEAGLARALSTLYSNWSSSATTSNVSMGVGTYSAAKTTSGGRHLVTSTGTVGGVTRSVSSEVKAPTGSALDYALAGGGNVTWTPGSAGHTSGTLTGDIYAGGNLALGGTVTGNVTYGGSVSGSYSGTATNPAPAISWPTVSNSFYKTIAQSNGQYFSGDKTYSSSSPIPANPAGGVIYVKGNILINGDQTTNACIFTEGNITVVKSGSVTPSITVTQYSNYPAIVALGNITIDARGNSSDGSAFIVTGLIYTGGNFDIIGNHYDNPQISITGSIVSRGNITTSLQSWNTLNMSYVRQSPPGFNVGNSSTSIVSYNQ